MTGVLDTSTPGPPLTNLGWQQAGALAHSLQHIDLDSMFASTMVRTQQTGAEPARDRGQELKVRSGIREVDAGALHLRSDTAAFEQYLAPVFHGVGLTGFLRA